jgi:hypothetical protein
MVSSYPLAYDFIGDIPVLHLRGKRRCSPLHQLVRGIQGFQSSAKIHNRGGQHRGIWEQREDAHEGFLAMDVRVSAVVFLEVFDTSRSLFRFYANVFWVIAGKLGIVRWRKPSLKN